MRSTQSHLLKATETWCRGLPRPPCWSAQLRSRQISSRWGESHDHSMEHRQWGYRVDEEQKRCGWGYDTEHGITGSRERRRSKEQKWVYLGRR